MKIKKLSFFLLFAFFYSNALMAAAPRTPYARAVPLAYLEKETAKVWYVLLGQNSSDGSWSDFGLPINDDEPKDVAQRALKEQTNDIYNISMDNPILETKNETGDIFFFVKVPFKSRTELNENKKTSVKKDFVWHPALTIKHLDFGENLTDQINPISLDFHKAFRGVWFSPVMNESLAKAREEAPIDTPAQPINVTQLAQQLSQLQDQLEQLSAMLQS